MDEELDLRIDNIISFLNKTVNQDVSVIDAMIEYADKNQIEIEVLAGIIKKNSIMKSKLTDVAQSLKLIKNDTQISL